MPRRSRPKFTIRMNAYIFENEDGFVVRALELPVVSEPASTQRGAVKRLKGKMKTHLDKLNAANELSAVLDEAGFRSWVGSLEVKVTFNNSAEITLPLPEVWQNPLP
jgi:hypothetical protein